MTATPDRTIGQRFADCDEGALAEIHASHSGRMAAVAYRILGDRDLAADAVQLAFIKAWHAAATFDPAREIEPWLFAITRRAAIDTYRHHRSRSECSTVDFSHIDQAHPTVAGADEVTIQRWLLSQVRAAIATLSPPDRAVVTLAYLHELSHQEIAGQLNIPIGTVKSRIFRAQKRLAAKLTRELHPYSCECGGPHSFEFAS
ncbi:sigma-70 family RNA polymerase sigma factor [Catellatospora sp. NPDC049609]|uniref:RNA polymerase sigma factor n=1 Tax=Catellatospora sp. NPDC049609 TaxID=3155505 RepID=UPI0034300CA0